MGYLATGEIFENMLQLKHFGMPPEDFFRKWLRFMVEYLVSALKRFQGGSGTMLL